MNSKAWVLAAAMLASGVAQATCYTVYRADGSFLQEGSTTPVDLTKPLGDTVPEKFGEGATMTVSDLGVYCKDRRGDPVLAKAEPAVKKKTAAAASRKDVAAAKDAAAAKDTTEVKDTAAAKKEDAASASASASASGEEAAKKDAPAASGEEAAKKDIPAASGEEAAKKDAPAASGEEPKKVEEPATKQVAEQAAR